MVTNKRGQYTNEREGLEGVDAYNKTGTARGRVIHIVK